MSETHGSCPRPREGRSPIGADERRRGDSAPGAAALGSTRAPRVGFGALARPFKRSSPVASRLHDDPGPLAGGGAGQHTRGHVCSPSPRHFISPVSWRRWGRVPAACENQPPPPHFSSWLEGGKVALRGRFLVGGTDAAPPWALRRNAALSPDHNSLRPSIIQPDPTRSDLGISSGAGGGVAGFRRYRAGKGLHFNEIQPDPPESNLKISTRAGSDGDRTRQIPAVLPVGFKKIRSNPSAPVKRASTRVQVPPVQLDGSAPKTGPTASPRGGVGSRPGVEPAGRNDHMNHRGGGGDEWQKVGGRARNEPRKVTPGSRAPLDWAKAAEFEPGPTVAGTDNRPAGSAWAACAGSDARVSGEICHGE
jgi:hypothetical protein